MNKRTLLILISVFMSATVFAQDDSASNDGAEAETPPAVVITNEGLLDRCILPLVITRVNGEAVEEDAGRYEFEPGNQSFSGYAQGDFVECSTITDAGLGADSPIGEGSTTVNVPSGKEYFLGLDVRKSDPGTWKIVTWRINH